ncbi:MAG: DUF2726 domain-containing protein [Planctomycetota bacterium]
MTQPAPRPPSFLNRLLTLLRKLFSLLFPQTPPSPPRSPTKRYDDEPLPYRPARHLLSRGEQAFWKPLFLAVKGKYRIFTKVRLADVVYIPRGPKSRSDFGKIKGYHVDFVLADPDTTRPLLAIELDDRTHHGKRQQERDAFKDRVLEAAGIPILRIQAQQAYDPIELREAIDDHLATAAVSGNK